MIWLKKKHKEISNLAYEYAVQMAKKDIFSVKNPMLSDYDPHNDKNPFFLKVEITTT